jgi:2,3-bisphosphoglycerate-dependent phosphoglycerate mutase
VLVLLRHGQSLWNRDDLFTGWTDVDLSEQGVAEAKAAGRRLAAAGFGFELCYTSVLKRAIKTLDLSLDEMDLLWLPVEKSWRLNERHYGALQGLNKVQTAAKHGADQVQRWRRSWHIAPPPLELSDPRHPAHDRRYAKLPRADLPASESLKETVDRTLPLWHERIAPALRVGNRVLIAAHGNSLRGLVKYLSNIDDADIASFEIPTGNPLIYELDGELRPTRRYFLSGEG